MTTVSLQLLRQRAEQVYQVISPTPQIQWPLLSQRAGCEVWLKHENHNPTGSFKVRGGLIYLSNLKKSLPGVEGVRAKGHQSVQDRIPSHQAVSGRIYLSDGLRRAPGRISHERGVGGPISARRYAAGVGVLPQVDSRDLDRT